MQACSFTHLKVFKRILYQVLTGECLIPHKKELDRVVEYTILIANVVAILYREVSYYLLQGIIHHAAMKHFHTQKVEQAKAINEKVPPLDSAANAKSGRCQRNEQNQRYCSNAEANIDSHSLQAAGNINQSTFVRYISVL